MKLVGLMPCRNEDWVLGLSARIALMWCDQLIVADHGSTDGSRDIMNQFHREYGAERFLVRDDREYEWREMEQRQMLLECAREEGATHIAIIDADEILTGNLVGKGSMTWECWRGSQILSLPGYNLRGSLNRYHDSGIWGKRWFSLAFADSPELHWGGDRFHSREPIGRKLNQYRPIQQGQGGVLHLWGASERRLKAKSAWYKVTERIRWPEKSVVEIDRMYSWAIHGERGMPYGNPNTWTYADVPEAWWAPYAHLMQYLHVDREPWQEQETRRLVAEHGAECFRDLDLFGVV